ncbi:MAG: PH domain-containing protein [Patescibacteria group bacterium]|jgi:uncharacterized membrane protein YdbT with pleckstrin-like domain
MDIKFDFPGLTENEKVYMVIHKHWIVLARYFFFAFIMVMVPVVILLVPDMVAGLGIGTQSIALVGGMYFLIMCAFFITVWIDYYNDIMLVTSKRIVNIEQDGLFNYKVSDLPLERVVDLSTSENGILAQIFGFGDVHLHTASDAPNFDFITIPKPHEVSKNIKNVLELHDVVKQSLSQKQGEGT